MNRRIVLASMILIAPLAACGKKSRPVADLAASRTTTIGINSYLWRAALDTLSFMPLVQTDSNGGVIVKLASLAERLGISQDERDLLEDIGIENNQCLRQADIRGSVLAGLMDARGNIINNNMNVLLKNLTVINIVFLPLNLLASVGGMSEFSIWTKGLHWSISYGLFMLALTVLGLATWWILNRRVCDTPRRHPAALARPDAH